MKTLLILTIFSFYLQSCSRDIKNDLTEEQKSAIIKDITRTFFIAGEGITELNSEKAFSAFSKKEGTKYIRDGYLYPDIETAMKQYAEWFRNPDAVKRVTTYDTLIFDLLDEKTVLMTCIASLSVIGDTTGQKPWTIAYTGSWRKEDEGWRLMNMHNSWE